MTLWIIFLDSTLIMIRIASNIGGKMSPSNKLLSLCQHRLSTRSLIPARARALSFPSKRGLGAFVVGLLLCASPTVWAQFTPPQEGLIGWWRGEGNANNSGGTNDGTLLAGVT